MESVHGTVAGLDVHKKTVVVVVLQSDHSDEDHAAGVFGTTRYGLNELIAFLRQHGVTHAAMESTAQYWRPVWMALEGQFTMTLAQARSTRAPRGRKWDKADAQRIAKRLLSGDLTVSYVPPPEQRDWRLLSRTQVAMHESVVRVRNQVEVLLEQAQIKLSSVVTDILGKSGRRMLDALVRGVSDPVELARLGDRRLHASKEQLADALSGQLTEAQRIVLKLYLEQIDLIERHMAEIDESLAQALVPHQDAIERLCEIPGIGVRTAQHIVAETGPRAEVFDSAGKLASWAGMCPGQQESAGVSVSSRSAKGNWMLRRTLCQTAWAAIATKGSEAQRRFHRWRPRLGTQKAAWAIAHYQIRIVWKVLHDGVRYRSPDTEVMLSVRCLHGRSVPSMTFAGWAMRSPSHRPKHKPLAPSACQVNFRACCRGEAVGRRFSECDRAARPGSPQCVRYSGRRRT
jgi:transposase